MRRTWIFAAALVAASCASTKTGGKSGGPGASEPGASASAAGGGGAAAAEGGAQAAAAPADKATQDFLEQTSEIAERVKSGKVDWEDVADRMKSVTKKHPKYAPAWYNLGLAYESLGKKDDAEDAYGKASTYDPNLTAASENLAGMRARSGDSRSAVQMLRELVSKDPKAANARVALAKLRVVESDYEEAVRLSQEALKYDPKNVDAYCVLARSALGQKDSPRARLVVAQGLKIDQRAGCLHEVLGLVLLQDKETATGLGELERAIETNPELTEAHFRIAQVAMDVKDCNRAVSSYTAVTKVEPRNTTAWVNMGVGYKCTQNFAEAEKAYLKAIEAGGDQPVPLAHLNLGILYLRNMNRPEDAKTQLKRYLSVGNPQGNDAAYQMLEEIEQQKAAAEEAARQAEQEKREEAIRAKAAAEEAERAKQKEAEEAAEKARQQKIEEKARQEGEPTSPK